jgi:hypothetical protein
MRPEGKRARFERLAEKRVNEAIKKLRLVGNLSNRHNYDYTEGHVKQMVLVLDQELRRVRARFREEGAGRRLSFSFDKRNKRHGLIETKSERE